MNLWTRHACERAEHNGPSFFGSPARLVRKLNQIWLGGTQQPASPTLRQRDKKLETHTARSATSHDATAHATVPCGVKLGVGRRWRPSRPLCPPVRDAFIAVLTSSILWYYSICRLRLSQAENALEWEKKRRQRRRLPETGPVTGCCCSRSNGPAYSVPGFCS